MMLDSKTGPGLRKFFAFALASRPGGWNIDWYPISSADPDGPPFMDIVIDDGPGVPTTRTVFDLPLRVEDVPKYNNRGVRNWLRDIDKALDTTTELGTNIDQMWPSYGFNSTESDRMIRNGAWVRDISRTDVGVRHSQNIYELFRELPSPEVTKRLFPQPAEPEPLRPKK
jgi:hypothetical protein